VILELKQPSEARPIAACGGDQAITGGQGVLRAHPEGRSDQPAGHRARSTGGGGMSRFITAPQIGTLLHTEGDD